MMRTVPDLGVYIHFPYCRKLCPYCDFAVAVAHPEPPHEVYLAAVLAELAARAPAVLAGGAPALRSIYFGGGTPSWWRPDCLAAVVEAVITTLAPGTRAAALEITLEANPSDCTPASLAGWRAAGINRVSIGVQSLDDGELRVLGRDHRHGDGAAAIAAARAAGLRSVSGDAILGAPRPGRATSPAPALADLGCDHVSAYELTIEARTAFGKRTAAGRMVPRDEDELAALYLATDEAMRARGFEHYEISSYARPGHRAVHNSLYWSGGDFLGLGAGAASFLSTPDAADGGGVRTLNTRRARAYLAAPTAAGSEHRHEPAAEVARDRLWLGLRTSDGVDAALVGAAGADAALAGLAEAGLVELARGRWRPTLRGFLFSDQIARRVVAG
ncbi:MAG: coproporphyrinogen III oxidase family protein [Kofleriaceae bacterium]|nr:coproporphyrinogen III oxidase family protein [Kofleriaceae bacterium]MBP6838647.1 coproporphyrinogen III oxidase family protein [Kofleriaceae bacterium]MBP9207743.1 coproporphyrinogen III oxidase family protein [Kofleriaceae bacterium]